VKVTRLVSLFMKTTLVLRGVSFKFPAARFPVARFPVARCT